MFGFMTNFSKAGEPEEINDEKVQLVYAHVPDRVLTSEQEVRILALREAVNSRQVMLSINQDDDTKAVDVILDAAEEFYRFIQGEAREKPAVDSITETIEKTRIKEAVDKALNSVPAAGSDRFA